MDDLKKYIREIPDFPKPGVRFYDISTLIHNAEGFNGALDRMEEYAASRNVDRIVGIEARGFVFGAALADRLDKGLVIARKPGKLPGDTVSQEYELEYGTDVMEIHEDALIKDSNVLLIDDLLATGGTAEAAAALVEKLGGKVSEMAFIVNLPDVGGEKRLKDKGYKLFCLTEFEGD